MDKFSSAFLFFIAKILCCAVIAASESANVTRRGGEYDVTGLYARFYSDVLEFNSKDLTEQCRVALMEYKRGLGKLEDSAVKSKG